MFLPCSLFSQFGNSKCKIKWDFFILNKLYKIINEERVSLLKKLIVITVVLSSLYFESGFIYANNDDSECQKKIVEVYNKYYKEIKKDLLNRYSLNLSLYDEYTVREVDKLGRYLKNKKSLSSLMELFDGEFYGQKYLLIKKNQLQGYVLYKNNEGNNILQTIKNENNKWVIVSTKSKNAQKIILKKEEIRCN